MGAAAIVVSPIAALTGITLAATESGHGGGLVVGPVLYVGGGLLLAGSIPCIIVGGVKKKRSMNVYNDSCVQKEQQVLQLSLQTTQNGIGLALNF